MVFTSTTVRAKAFAAAVTASLAMGGLGVMVATAGAAEAVNVLPVQTVADSGDLSAVSCPSATVCEAVGENSAGQGLVTTITNGVPGPVDVVPSAQQLSGIACPTATDCTAVGISSNVGIVLPISNGVPDVARAVSGTTDLRAVACPSAQLCVAVGFDTASQGVVVPLNAGSAGNPQSVSGTNGLLAVDCATTTTCQAVGAAPNSSNSYALGAVVAITNGTPGPLQIVPGGELTLLGVSCPDATTCEAVGSDNASPTGITVAIADGHPGSQQAVPGTSGLIAVDCTSVAECASVGQDSSGLGTIVPLTGGAAGTAQTVAGTYQLYGAACPSATSCEAVGSSSPGFASKGVTVAFAPVATFPAPDPTTTTVSSTPNPSTAGQSVTFTAHVVAQNSGDSTPTGSITLNGSPITGSCSTTPCPQPAELGSASLNANGTATITTNSLQPGDYDVTASYSGDSYGPQNAHHLPSQSSPKRQTVNAAGNVPPPTVASISPASGPLAGGTTLTLNGTGLAGVTSVSFANTSASVIHVVSDTQITVTSPPATSPGPVPVTVTSPQGSSTPVTFTYTPPYRPPLPEIVSVLPSSGYRGGGDTVIVTGGFFTGATQVLVGATAATFHVVDAEHIQLVTPAHALGPVHIQVVTPAGSSAPGATDQFVYTNTRTPAAPRIGSLTPASVPEAGPEPVITMRGDRLDTVTQVLVGGQPVPFTQDVLAGGGLFDTGEFNLKFTPPAHTPGLVPVVVIGAGGASNKVFLTYRPLPAPRIGSLTPSSVPEAGPEPVITMRGDRLDTVTQLLVGGQPVPFTQDVLAGGGLFDTGEFNLQFTPPAHTPGLVPVVVMGAGGASNTAILTYR
ncbi:MAG: cell surface receptor protein [Marmoricola sp.]|nr:cell surface receptor protein [Marmoricola sp.]